MDRNKTYTLTVYALFTAIIALLGFTPLGFVMLPIAAITTVHIPVIVGGYKLGVKGGAVLGAMFGLMSLIRCFTTPDATAQVILGTDTGFGFYNVILIAMIIFLPRVLCGVFSALTYKGIAKRDRSKIFAMAVSAVVGSLTNTVFYLGGLYIFAFNASVEMMGLANATYLTLLRAMLALVSLNGVLEAVFAAIVCTLVGKALDAAEAKRA